MLGQVAHFKDRLRRCLKVDHLPIGTAARDRCHQAFRVGVLRVGVDLVNRAFFDDFALVHDNQPVGDFRGDAQVVGDQDKPHVLFVAQLNQQIQNLRLHGHIKRCCRFIGNQDFRLQCKSHGDHHALALTTGKLVWIIVGAAFGIGKLYPHQQLDSALPGFLGIEAAVHLEALGNLPANAINRIEMRQCILKNHGNLVAHQVATVGVGELE